MRPSLVLSVVLIVLLGCDLAMFSVANRERVERQRAMPEVQWLVAYAGLTDLCLSTEARYIRNPAATDPMAPFMDLPGAIEHFPSGSFYYPPFAPFPAK